MASKRKVKSREYIDDSDDPDDTGVKTKKSKLKSEGAGTESGEDEMIPLSAKRFVNVRTFNGKVLVDIREYYEDGSGERKPGRKGISLSVDQWEMLKGAIPEIDSKIQSK